MHTLRRLHFALIAFVAVLCLLCVQQGAASHALSHLADDESAESRKQPPKNGCDQCISYVSINGAAPTNVHAAPQIVSQFIAIAATAQKLFPSLAYRVYSARAPPISF